MIESLPSKRIAYVDILSDSVALYNMYIVDKLSSIKIANGRTLCVDCHKETPTYGIGAGTNG